MLVRGESRENVGYPKASALIEYVIDIVAISFKIAHFLHLS